MVRIHPDPPTEPRLRTNRFSVRCSTRGAIAQLGERLLCKQEVTGSIPVGSTRFVQEKFAECSAKKRSSQCILFYSAAL